MQDYKAFRIILLINILYFCHMSTFRLSTSLFIFTGLVLVLSCHRASPSDSQSGIPVEYRMGTKAKQDNLPEGYQKYIVSEEDLEAFIHNRILESKSKGSEIFVLSVTPYSFDGIPVFYVIDYNEGWEIVSADKRGPIVLGHNDTGSFDENMTNEPLLCWIESLGGDIISRRYDSGHEENISEWAIEREAACLKHWSSINAESVFIRNYIPETKVIHDSIMPPPGGHWELRSVESETLVDTVVNHLTQTSWHQHRPHNNACPFKSTPNLADSVIADIRSPAGCVAIAAAQLLYYYHYKIGTPVNAPSSAYCNDRNNASPAPVVHIDTTMSSTVWNAMSLNTHGSYDASYALIADIGKRVNMDYGDSGSGALSSDLQSVFSYYGLSLTYYDSYQPVLMLSSLQRGFPCYVSAYGTREHHFFNYYTYSNGHAFLVDGYKSYYTKYTKTYEWIEPLSPDEQSIIEDMIVIEYSTPYITTIQMNWGWDTSNNNETFSISGDWETIVNGQTRNYIYEREMFYGYY